MLMDKIKADQLQARKDRAIIEGSLLTTLIGEATAVGKNKNRDTTDSEVVEVIQKFLKNLRDLMKVVNSLSDGYQQAEIEKCILERYLPKQLSAQEIADVISAMKANGAKNMGDVMKKFKTEYAGQYDGDAVSKAAKEAFQ